MLPMVLGLDLDLVARSAVGLSIAATAFRGGAAFAVIDQPRMPTLSGAFEHVGVRYETCGGARVKVFYPAAAPSDVAAPYCTDGRDTSDGMAGLVGFRQTGLSFLLSHLSDAQSGCWLDAPPAEAKQRPPVLVYSHGFGGNMDMASYMFRTFAAHGIIVPQSSIPTAQPASPSLSTRPRGPLPHACSRARSSSASEPPS